MTSNNLEDILLDDKFYSAPTSNGRNNHHHIANLRSSVVIPKSTSSSSISKSLLSSNEKTTSMKISPSMKQLETILQEKHKNTPFNNAITEEDEEADESEDENEDEQKNPHKYSEDEENNLDGKPKFLYPTIFSSINPSVQTFETAKSHDSTESAKNPVEKDETSQFTAVSANNSAPEKKYADPLHDSASYTSLQPDDTLIEEQFDSGYPRLAQPISLNRPGSLVKIPITPELAPTTANINGSSNSASKHSSNSHYSTDKDSVSTKTSSTNVDSEIQAGRGRPKHPYKPKSMLRTDSFDEDTKAGNQSQTSSTKERLRKSSERERRDREASRERRRRKQPRGLTDESELESDAFSRKPSFESKESRSRRASLVSRKLRDSSRSRDQPSSRAKSTTDNNSFPPLPKHTVNQLLEGKFSNSPTSPETNKKPATPNIGASPRTRSASSISSLSYTAEKTPKPTENTQVRSKTLGDISNFNEDKSKNKKKFSLRSLFKLKSKSNGLSEEGKVETKPKPPSKSFSSPNISNFAEAEPKQNTKNKKKSQDNVMNAFKKTKSSDNIANFFSSSLTKVKSRTGLDKKAKNDTVANSRSNEPLPPLPKLTSNEKPQVPASIKSSKSEVLAPKSNLNDSSYANDSAKLRKEISQVARDPRLSGRGVKPGAIDDDSDEDDFARYEPDVSVENSEEEYEYDAKNLQSDPPTKLANTRKDEEIQISPFQADFGSPFEVKYSGSINSPEKSKNSPEKSSKAAEKLSQVLLDNKLSINDSPASKKSIARSDSKRAALLGEALFPKSLSAQEVESIVSLERSRSMRSIISNKRSSYANYNGSDENVIKYNGPLPSSPVGTIRRSGSILKGSTSRKSLDQELANMSLNLTTDKTAGKTIPKVSDAPNSAIGNRSVDDAKDESMDVSIDNSIKQNYNKLQITDDASDDASFRDLIEFSDFIDVDNLSFSKSPKPVSESPLYTRVDSASETKNLDDTDNFTSSAAFTLNLETIDPAKIPSPQLYQEPFTASTTETDPALNGVKNSPSPVQAKQPLPIQLREKKGTPTMRPISMSFGGLKNGFGGALVQHNLRSSESHQSFNISFDDDTDYSGVGGGFGSSGEEDVLETPRLEEDSNISDSEYSYNDKKIIATPNLTINQPQESRDNMALSLPKPPNKTFMHDKIPSISSNNSSPRSFSSMISRKWKKSPQSPKAIVPLTNSVRFSSRIILYDTYNGEEYDRHPDTATCNQLTPILAQQIKAELNDFKSQMEIHTDSQCYTHFF